MTAAYDAFMANPDPMKWAYLAKMVILFAVLFGGCAIMLVQSYRR